MKSGKEPSGEERDLFELFSKSALNDYPNPDRVGCPGDAFLKQLATNRKSVPMTDPRLDHVLHCSPCFREFTAFRDNAAKAPRGPVGQKAIITSLAVAAALLVGVYFRGAMVRRHPSDDDNKSNGLTFAQISLQDRSVVRGAAKDAKKMAALQLPRGQLKLTVLLPFGSEASTYEVQILREVERPLLTASSKAKIDDGITKFTVDVDTEPLAAGKYLLGVREPPLDWTYNPLTIK